MAPLFTMQKNVKINTEFDPQVLSELSKQCSEFNFSKAELIKMALYAVSEIGFNNLIPNTEKESTISKTFLQYLSQELMKFVNKDFEYLY